MPIIVELVSGTPSLGIQAAILIDAEMPTIDGCPVLNRTKAFLVDQGVPATLEHIFRDRKGRPVDLTAWLEGTSESSASSSSGTATGSAVLRIKDILGVGAGPKNPIWTIEARSPDPSAGILWATLPESAVECAGILQLSWAVLDAAGVPVLVNDGLLSVERSLFAASETTRQKDLGPPTLNELRMEIMDSSPAENFWLQDTEFKDEQIVLAIQKPVEYWNEQPPPINVFTTRTFPFRGNWRRAVIAQMFMMAAHNYRRTRLPHTAGGVTVDDRNKEREYLSEGQRLWEEYKQWVQMKKLEINLRLVSGSVGSTYGSFGRF